jgi:hypothetical protein
LDSRVVKFKKETIEQFRAETANLRRMLEPYESGRAFSRQDGRDTTAVFFEEIKRGIAAYETALGRLEKQVRDAKGTPSRRTKRRDRRVMSLDDFTDEDIAALEAVDAPESSKAFDDELNQP